MLIRGEKVSFTHPTKGERSGTVEKDYFAGNGRRVLTIDETDGVGEVRKWRAFHYSSIISTLRFRK